jgi:hypothetical protein
MAQKVQVLLVDDVDGGQADETVTFGLDGVTYEIDLSEAHAKSLRDALGTWLGHARKVGAARPGPKPRASAGRPRGGVTGLDLQAVRAWARNNGFQVSDRGRVSSQVLSAYENAH